MAASISEVFDAEGKALSSEAGNDLLESRSMDMQSLIHHEFCSRDCDLKVIRSPTPPMLCPFL